MFLKTKNQKSKTNSGFSMIELMVAIIIFTIGGLSAYLLVYSAINSSIRSKSEIIASNIARQQIELIKNIRDTNWLQFKTWNKLDNAGSLGETLTGGYYTIENNFNLTNPIKITNISSDFDGSESKVLSSSSTVKLCLDNKDRYTHE
ncbi:prepilin-type N-terminal cleavage/methylation domain-containing protein, partial [Candidatus Gracilibacteria bacterium]|nr:prepilin-type N-terminal cleavage/methylation domain-containing protein [Candidatus Gracilibacteria bacterium]